MVTSPALYLIRHGRTEWNAQGRLQGRLNSELLPDSIAAVHQVGRALAGFGIRAVYASPLGRCRQTLEILSCHLSVAPVYLDDLMECDHGKCEGLSLQEAMAAFPTFFKDRAEQGKWDAKWPDGESYSDVAIRAQKALQQIQSEGIVLIVAHETINKVLVGLLTGKNKDETMALKQGNDEIFHIFIDKRAAETPSFYSGKLDIMRVTNAR